MSKKGTSFDEVLASLSNDEKFQREDRKLKPYFDLLLSMIKRRRELHLSQAGLAKRANTYQSRISQIESGEFDVRLSTIVQIAEALDCEVEIKLNPVTADEALSGVENTYVRDFRNWIVLDDFSSQDYQEYTEAGAFEYGPIEAKAAV